MVVPVRRIGADAVRPGTWVPRSSRCERMAAVAGGGTGVWRLSYRWPLLACGATVSDHTDPSHGDKGCVITDVSP